MTADRPPHRLPVEYLIASNDWLHDRGWTAAGWYFWCDSWTKVDGPHPSWLACEHAYRAYRQNLSTAEGKAV